MKPATVAARQTIERDHAVRVKPRVIAEWEYNRFTLPVVTVSPEQGVDAEWQVTYGDLDTITTPNRPRTGIAKARADAGVKPAADYRDSVQAARFYPSDPDDLYNYWSSSQRSKLVASGGSYQFDSPIQLTVTYPEQIAANKIVVGFETSYAKPVNFTIEASTDGTTWFTVATDPVMEPDGIVSLWRGTNAWDIDKDYRWPQVIKAVRLKVLSMNKAFSHVDVLQLGARLESDLSDFVMDYNTQMEVADRSFIAPLGKASSNQANVTLSNIDGLFNNHNEDSLYYGMIDKKVKFTIDLGIDASKRGGIAFEYIREFTGWTESWGGQDQTSVNVDLKDSSVILQEQKMPVVFFENATTGAIIWQIMDRVGMANYSYARSTQDFGQVISFYWPEDDNTVWEEFANLAEATQTAIYFDENDVLQIRARKAMFAEKAVDWNFDAISNGLKLPDIQEAEIDYDLETNTVAVNYKPAAYSDFQKGLPKLETVWEPEEETVLLRASGLVKDLTAAGTELWVRQADARFWPYESTVNIRGEFLRYKGKEYAYYRADNAVDKKVIYTLDEQKTLDALNETYSFKNNYTGKFIVTERAMYGSPVSSHKVQGAVYYSAVTNFENTLFYPWESGGVQYMDGFIRQTNNGTGATNGHNIHFRRHESALQPYATADNIWYGMRFRFPFSPLDEGFEPSDEAKAQEATATANWRKGGLWFRGSDADAGYFLELSSTSQIDGWEDRRWNSEIQLIAMNNNAQMYNPPGAPDRRGYQFGIRDNVWYDLDVNVKRRADNYLIVNIYLDGVSAGVWEIPPAAQVAQNDWRFGSFVRGPATMDIEYLYGVTRDETDTQNPDATNWLDLRSGGYTSGFIQKEFTYNFRFVNPYWFVNKRLSYPFPQRINSSNFVFDEFGPVVHEVREFSVKFKEENRPVGHSNLLLSNEGQAEVCYYESNAFGANFMIANASRHDVILHGEDTITAGVDNSINRTMFIYGRSVYQEEEKTLTKTDELSVRKRGTTKTEVASRYIQTDEMANELGQWIIDLWATGVDQVTLTTFGNPFLQLGDLVTINYPIKDMYPATHKYWVVSIQNEFREGYSSEVILRRARI